MLIASDWAPIRAFDALDSRAPRIGLRRSASASPKRRPPSRQLRVRPDDRRSARVEERRGVQRRSGARRGPDRRGVRRRLPREQSRARLRRGRPAPDDVGPSPEPHPHRRRRPDRQGSARAADPDFTRRQDPHRQHQRGRGPDRVERRPGRVRVGPSEGPRDHPTLQEVRRRRARDCTLRSRVHPLPAALCRGRVPVDGRGRRRLRRRAPSSRAARPGVPQGTAHRVLARQLRVLPEDGFLPSQGRLLRGAAASQERHREHGALPLPHHRCGTAPPGRQGRRGVSPYHS